MAHMYPRVEHSPFAETDPPRRAATPTNANGSSRTSVELPARRLIIALAAFSAVSAIAGATSLIVWRMGSQYVPLTLLEHTPFTSFLIPGLLLGVVVGCTSLACTMLMWRHSLAAVDATILAGGALTVWIIAEVAMMRSFHVLHGIYGGIGLSLLALGVRTGWRSHSPRHRWVILAALAETVGYFAPACTGVLSTRASLDEVSQAALLVVAGLVEGLALGIGQAWAFPLPVRRARYAARTALGAGGVWSCVMVMMWVAGSKSVPVAVVILVGVATAIVGLAAIGSVQFIELRRHSRGAHRWIAWTALAWAAALPFSFAPGPLVDESTPVSSQVVLWGCGGWLMAYVMALITWQGVRRLARPDPLGSLSP